MSGIKVRRLSSLYARFCGCPDKSITVRAVLLGAIADGETVILNALDCEDVSAAIDCARTLGATVEVGRDKISVIGAKRVLDNKVFNCKRSGTVLRLLCGILSGLGVTAVLDGDEQLKKRPIDRVIQPLVERGAFIKTTDGGLPITIYPSKLREISYEMTVDSAQVKSALLLSGVAAGVKTTVTERNRTRAHTEKMLPSFGVSVDISGKTITAGCGKLKGNTVCVPNDPSAVAYYIALGLFLGGVAVYGVNVSSERAGYLYKLKECGADIRFVNQRTVCGEPCADVFVGKSEVKYITIEPSEIPSMIDELPVIGLIGSLSCGALIKNAGELRKKESDRFSGMIDIINRCGKKAYARGDDIIIENVGQNREPFDYASDDHRLVMTAFTAMSLNGGGVITTPESVNKSFPDFFNNFYSFNACLIGSNVGKSLSGNTHNYLLGRFGVVNNYTYEHISANSDLAEKILSGNDFKSVNVTVPYKELAFGLVKESSADARLARSVNFIFDGKGYTFDGDGLVYSLKLHGIDLKGKKVLVCGAGGAGRSIVSAFCKKGATVFLHNRTKSKAERFISEVCLALKSNSKRGECVLPSVYNGERFDVVVNATSCKAALGELPIDKNALEGCAVAVDINYGAETAFGMLAKGCGVPCIYGGEMLFAQSYFADALVSGKNPSFDEFAALYDDWIKTDLFI